MRKNLLLKFVFNYYFHFSQEHYVHAARAEQETFDAQVTDWELMRNFERP
jgi:glutamine synthetase